MRGALRLSLGLACWAGAMGAMHGWQSHIRATEYLSVPPVRTAQALGAGFQNIAADALYLQFINYFGKHFLRDREYHNVEPVLDLVTSLDPQFYGAYQLGALALGDDHQLDTIERLWRKGMRANPQDWRYPYMCGMDIFLFGNQPEQYLKAAGYFKQASTLPKAPPFTRFMEARMYSVTARREMAIQVWLDTYRHSPSREARGVAARSLKFLGVKLPGER